MSDSSIKTKIRNDRYEDVKNTDSFYLIMKSMSMGKSLKKLKNSNAVKKLKQIGNTEI